MFFTIVPDLHRRLRGIGDPAYKHYALVPHFDCGVPHQIVTAEDVDLHRAEGEDFSGKPIDLNVHNLWEPSSLSRSSWVIGPQQSGDAFRKKGFKPEVVSFASSTT